MSNSDEFKAFQLIWPHAGLRPAVLGLNNSMSRACRHLPVARADSEPLKEGSVGTHDSVRGVILDYQTIVSTVAARYADHWKSELFASLLAWGLFIASRGTPVKVRALPTALPAKAAYSCHQRTSACDLDVY